MSALFMTVTPIFQSDLSLCTETFKTLMTIALILLSHMKESLQDNIYV